MNQRMIAAAMPNNRPACVVSPRKIGIWEAYSESRGNDAPSGNLGLI
ncbi:MAG: hypothetical protein MHPDNHAH_03111 [Anaerolineales bacterium]|nr:hypothetical protein [Anaerolineales bacterium]